MATVDTVVHVPWLICFHRQNREEVNICDTQHVPIHVKAIGMDLTKLFFDRQYGVQYVGEIINSVCSYSHLHNNSLLADLMPDNSFRITVLVW